MRRVLLCLVIFLFLPTDVFAVTRTVSWDPVTTYTDNTPIESNKLPVIYDIKMDNVVICVVIENTSCTFEHANANQDHIFNARARLQTGEESVWSPNFLWHCPPARSIITAPPIILDIIK